MYEKRKDAAVFILMGQSNAVCFATSMTEEDKIREPLKNVFGLDRKYNLSYDNQELTWSGYTSHGTILGEGNDHTYSVANCLARLWQQQIDQNMDLPDLYIIHIAIGAQGVTKDYMWYPKREKKLIPGPLGTVDISLYPLAIHIFSLLDDSFQKLEKDYEILGLHWRGGEEDTCSTEEELKHTLLGIYERMFQGFYESLKTTPPLTLHRIICAERMMDLDPSGKSLKNMHYIDEIFQKLEQDHENISVFDICQAPHYTTDTRQHGIFVEDAVHYTPRTNQWVAVS